jgi:hypothetical protein
MNLQEMDTRIAQMEMELRLLKSNRRSVAIGMCNDVLNSAAACDRDCCGNVPRTLAITEQKCNKSPIGTCVFNQRRDPNHISCSFCGLSECKE